jgi:hypothetical protein
LRRLQDGQGQTGALVVLEDVTARISLEEQLQQREKLSSIGLLAAGVAHEVNTPLTGVSSYTQMLLGMLNENDPKHALLQKVRTQAERATNIVNNLLNFSRTGSATEFAKSMWRACSTTRCNYSNRNLRRSQIEIVRVTMKTRRKLMATPASCSRCLRILILNARDAIPDGGTSRLCTETAEDGSLVAESPIQVSVSLRRTSPRFTIRSTRPKALAREPDWVLPCRTELFRNTRANQCRQHTGSRHNLPHHLADRARPRSPPGRRRLAQKQFSSTDYTEGIVLMLISKLLCSLCFLWSLNYASCDETGKAEFQKRLGARR